MKKTIEIEEPKQQKHLPDHYIDIMLEKYKPAKTKAGEEYIGNPLEYFTIQQNFMSTDEEWDFVAKTSAQKFSDPVGFTYKTIYNRIRFICFLKY